MTELVSTVQNIKRHINPKLKIGGAFMTMANDTNFRKDIVASVKATYQNDKLWATSKNSPFAIWPDLLPQSSKKSFYTDTQ